MSNYNEIFILFAQKDKVEKDVIPMMLRQAGIVISKNNTRKILSEYDDNVTYESFLEIIEQAKSCEIDVNFVRKAFQRYDPNNSGYISACVLKNMMVEKKEEFMESEVEEIIKVLAPDSDGRINYELFIKKLMSEK